MEQKDYIFLFLFLITVLVTSYFSFIGGSERLCTRLHGKLAFGEKDSMFSPVCLVEGTGDLKLLKCCECKTQVFEGVRFGLNGTED